MKELFDMISKKSSKLTTVTYSTSFSLGIRFFSRRFHDPIYAIYGFVRFADEIVDSFHGYNKPRLLERFRADTYLAIEEKISLNPILNNFQWVVNKYGIEKELIDLFLDSMEMDLKDISYDQQKFEKYILGSAEVVGLMCLRVFCEGDDEKYRKLKPPAMRLGSAFQKINFLRDLHADFEDLGRSYFPGIDLTKFDDETKKKIEDDIALDFADGLEGIRMLPRGARFGVYMAYVYFHKLFLKIKRTRSSRIMKERIRIPNRTKYKLLFTSYLKHQFNLL
ncbi:phytoene/squalene synthase family protein [Lentimicrobium sp.]|jgi:phytoene/squalene synthetase|uniref:phytoene/squalene synthase family protein n=1 Tax=Lentimicrobium sp. TaxID=2034841 RepID=UPI002BD2253F|nr:phytoene/squalene synthase family protein [Lentimicrobium sp.]MCO5263123.1 phytoene/squalene synthase family protein [Lentimicrobium sp.]HPJ62754.1 phytoene/squalene synthase family protein [Lentimicrobium sp.]